MPEPARIVVTVDNAAWRRAVPRAAALCRRAALAALAGGGGPAAVEASILLTDDATVRSLNARYRDRDAPTNVLSFPQHEELPAAAGECVLLGDVVVAFETVRDEALRDSLPLADHLCHMIVHGMLHLLGYDHQDDGEAERMETLEVDILASMGVGSPYVDRLAG